MTMKKQEQHELKVLNKYFVLLLSDEKKFELRKNDRDYKVGDMLILREWVPNIVHPNNGKDGHYTGRFVVRFITFILKGGVYGLDSDYVILSIARKPSYTLL